MLRCFTSQCCKVCFDSNKSRREHLVLERVMILNLNRNSCKDQLARSVISRIVEFQFKLFIFLSLLLWWTVTVCICALVYTVCACNNVWLQFNLYVACTVYWLIFIQGYITFEFLWALIQPNMFSDELEPKAKDDWQVMVKKVWLQACYSFFLAYNYRPHHLTIACDRNSLWSTSDVT